MKKTLVTLSLLVVLLVGSIGNETFATTKGKVPDAPVVVVDHITPSPDFKHETLTISWKRSSDPSVIGYRIFDGRWEDSDVIATIKQPSRHTKIVSYIAHNDYLSGNYSIYVRAYNKNGVGAATHLFHRIMIHSPHQFPAPVAPKRLRITSANDNHRDRSINLEWKKNTDSGNSTVKGYRVFLNGKAVAIVDQPSSYSKTVHITLHHLNKGMNTVYVTAYNIVYKESARSNKDSEQFKH